MVIIYTSVFFIALATLNIVGRHVIGLYLLGSLVSVRSEVSFIMILKTVWDEVLLIF